MTTPQNRVNSDPSMRDLLDVFKKEIMLSLNCHALATIQGFDPATQLVTATINYKKAILQADPITGTYSQVLIDYPILIDCPVVIMQGGDGFLSFPIAAGDTCLILFNDRDMDNWLSSGQIGPLATQRMHSFADGIALIGVRSSNDPIALYDGARVVLQNKNAKVGLGQSLIKIENSTRNLNTLLQTLVTQIKSLVTQITAITVNIGLATSTPPNNSAAIAAISTQLTTTANEIGELLE